LGSCVADGLLGKNWRRLEGALTTHWEAWDLMTLVIEVIFFANVLHYLLLQLQVLLSSVISTFYIFIHLLGSRSQYAKIWAWFDTLGKRIEQGFQHW
jgi:hypothetical protein